MAKVMVSFPSDFLQKVDRAARSQGRSRSGLIREALRVTLGREALPRRSWKEAVAPLRELEARGWGSGTRRTSSVTIATAAMGSKIVVDTSVLIKWFKTRDEELVEEAKQLLRGDRAPPYRSACPCFAPV